MNTPPWKSEFAMVLGRLALLVSCIMGIALLMAQQQARSAKTAEQLYQELQQLNREALAEDTSPEKLRRSDLIARQQRIFLLLTKRPRREALPIITRIADDQSQRNTLPDDHPLWRSIQQEDHELQHSIIEKDPRLRNPFFSEQFQNTILTLCWYGPESSEVRQRLEQYARRNNRALALYSGSQRPRRHDERKSILDSPHRLLIIACLLKYDLKRITNRDDPTKEQRYTLLLQRIIGGQSLREVAECHSQMQTCISLARTISPEPSPLSKHAITTVAATEGQRYVIDCLLLDIYQRQLAQRWKQADREKIQRRIVELAQRRLTHYATTFRVRDAYSSTGYRDLRNDYLCMELARHAGNYPKGSLAKLLKRHGIEPIFPLRNVDI